MPTDEGCGDTPASPPSSQRPFRPIRDAEEFRLTAIYIFGRIGWKRRTSEAFGVTESTIYRWVSESIPIPHYAASALAAWKIVFDLTGTLPPSEKNVF